MIVTGLWHDVQQQGYPGCYRTVSLFCRRLRQGERPQVAASPSGGPQTSERRGWSARQLSFLLVRPRDKRTEQEQQAWTAWREHEEAGAFAALGDAFLTLVRTRQADAL